MTSSKTPAPSWTPSTSSRCATGVVDEVRRRVQQDIHGHRGRRGDPLYRIRNILRAGQENVNDQQRARLETAWTADERHIEVEVA
jgi:transposase